MTKNEMIQELTVKVTVVKDTKDRVLAFSDEIEETVSVGKEAIANMEQELHAHQEALTRATDLGQAKLIKQQIDSVQEDIELQKAVNVGKAKAKCSELEDKAESFFAVHKSACLLFKSIDDYMLLNTSLSELYDTKATMSGFANALSGAFAGVRHVLIDTEIVALADQSRVYRGTHLGQRDQESKLTDFEYHVSPYIQLLRLAGYDIK